jgi:tetratricopeptide (TPR) repeat protein
MKQPTSGVAERLAARKADRATYALPMPERSRSHEQETESQRAFESALPSSWVDRRLVPDYGLDYTVQIFDEAGQTTPYSFHAQLKATDEPDLDQALSSLRFDRKWADHYWSLPLPVLIVRYHAPSHQLFARWFHAYNPHVALRRDSDTRTKTIGFRFSDSDRWSDDTPAQIERAVRAFMRFRSPELELPLRFNVSSSEVDPLPLVFALRSALTPVADIVSVEAAPADPGHPHIVVGGVSSTVALADVASVTLDYAADVERDHPTDAADVATAIAMALIRVGQPNLAALIASACAARSTAILNYDVTFPLAQAFYRARRTMEALLLADSVAARAEEDARLAAFVLHTAVLARGGRLSPDETRLAIDVSRRSLQRSEDRGDRAAAGADAYNLGQALSRTDDEAAIEAYMRAEEFDPTYDDRAYFHRELAGLLFETERFDEAAERYRRALELDGDPFTEVLMADALLWSGRYAEAQDAFGRYLHDGGEPRDAEWRLKYRALTFIRKVGGDQQERQPSVAASLIEPYDFESGIDADPVEALAAWRRALEVDACCGSAWFRLAILSLGIGDGPDPGAAFDIALTGAVLLRRSEGAWNNAVRLARAAELPDGVVRDCLRTAYRFCGTSVADAFIESSTGREDGAEDAGLLSMLEEVMREIDAEQRPTEFTMRVPDPEEGMLEVSFVTGLPQGAEGTAHDRFTDPAGS